MTNSRKSNLADVDREAVLLANMLELADQLGSDDTKAIIAEVVGNGAEQLCHDEYHQQVWNWIRTTSKSGRTVTRRNAENALELQNVPDHVWNKLDYVGEGAVDFVVEVKELSAIAQRRSAVQTMYKAISDLQSGADASLISKIALELGQVNSSITKSHTADEYAAQYLTG